MKKNHYGSSDDPLLTIVRKYERPDDSDIGMSLVWELESELDHERKTAIDSLIMLDDLHAASNIYWLSVNGSEHARAAAGIVLGRLCNDQNTADHLMNICLNDQCLSIRQSAAMALEMRGIRIMDLLEKNGLLD
jgi:hypothetical protein